MMMIEDDELRNLYQVSGEERLQKLETGILHLEKYPNDAEILTDLLREIHGLKGDSRSLGIESVELLSQQFEEILKRIQHQEIGLTVEVSNCLYQGLAAIEQLVQGAVTGTPTEVDVPQVINTMMAIGVETTIMHGLATHEFATYQPTPHSETELENDRPQTSLGFIEDEELRELYQTTSQERLLKLKTGLLQLEQTPDDEVLLSELLREIHSLKGDSRSAEVEVVAIFSAQAEVVLKSIQHKELALTSQINQALLQGLDVIEQLVHEAVTGEPSGIDIEQNLNSLIAIQPEPTASQQAKPDRSTLPDRFTVDAKVNETVDETVDETQELQEIYQVTTVERLQKIETGLLQLEKQPDNEETLAELLRETHSLKGDSRSINLPTVEALAHQIESIFEGIQRQEIRVTSQVSDYLYQGLDAIGQLAYQTTPPVRVDVAQVLNQLMTIAVESTPPAVTPEVSLTVESPTQDLPLPSLKVGDPYRIDTIRVHTRDLDALMTQTEELAATRIQISQTAVEIEQIATLWEDWKTSKSKAQSHSAASGTSLYEEKLEKLITRLRATAQEESTKLNLISRELSEKVRTLRLLPLSTMFQSFPRMVRDLAKQQSKAVELIIEGGETTVDKRILEEIKDSLMHMVRNAVDHGIETMDEREKQGKPAVATIWLRGYQTSNSVIIEVADDGRGLDVEKIKQTAIKRGLYRAEELESMTSSQLHALVLNSGFSTRTFITEISGRGVGLDVVRTNVERLKGNIQIESIPAQGCTFRIQLNTSLSTTNVILVEVQGILYGIPVEFVQMSLLVAQNQISTIDEREMLLLGDQAVPIINLKDLLKFSNSLALTPIDTEPSDNRSRPCVLLKVGETQVGFLVDRLLDTQEIVLKPLNPFLKQARYMTGATILGTGEVSMILNPPELLQALQAPATPVNRAEIPRRKSVILLVEDSPLVRIQERRLFENAGYKVVIAIDGLDGYEKLRTGYFDAVVSDVEMPRLDGLSLTAKIRQHSEYDQLPIILVTTLSSADDRQRGAKAGADAYITKGKFNQDFLLETLAKLVR